MTSCQNIQLLQPCECDDLTVETPSLSLATEEGGVLALIAGVAQYAVLFSVAKVSAIYDFIEEDITNAVDGSPLSIEPMMSNRTVNGFTLDLDALPDTANYRFNWKVRVTSA